MEGLLWEEGLGSSLEGLLLEGTLEGLLWEEGLGSSLEGLALARSIAWGTVEEGLLEGTLLEGLLWRVFSWMRASWRKVGLLNQNGVKLTRYISEGCICLSISFPEEVAFWSSPKSPSEDDILARVMIQAEHGMLPKIVLPLMNNIFRETHFPRSSLAFSKIVISEPMTFGTQVVHWIVREPHSEDTML